MQNFKMWNLFTISRYIFKHLLSKINTSCSVFDPKIVKIYQLRWVSNFWSVSWGAKDFDERFDFFAAKSEQLPNVI